MKQPEIEVTHASADTSRLTRECVTLPNGMHFCSAASAFVGQYRVGEQGMAYVMLGLHAPSGGLHASLTPEGARLYASQLLEAAEQVDEVNRKVAEAQLATTLAKKGGTA